MFYQQAITVPSFDYFILYKAKLRQHGHCSHSLTVINLKAFQDQTKPAFTVRYDKESSPNAAIYFR